LHRAGLYQRPQDISPPKFITIYISFVFCDRSVAKMTCSSPRSPGGQKTFRKKPTRDTLSPEAVQTRVIIVGVGGIGGVLAANLIGEPIDLTVATTNAEIRAAFLSGTARFE